MRLIQFQLLAELLKQFEHIVTCLVFDGADKHRPQQVIVNLDSRSFSSQHNELLGVLLEALTSFEEQHELLEHSWRKIEIILQHVLHCLTDEDGVLLIHTNKQHQLEKLRVDRVSILVLKQVLHDLLVVFLLRVQGDCLQQGSVEIVTEIHTISCEKVTVHEVFVSFAQLLCDNGRAENVVQDELNVRNFAVQLISLSDDSQCKLSNLFRVLLIVKVFFKSNLCHFFGIVACEQKAVKIRNRIGFDSS